MLRDIGFSVHMADPIRLALIFNTAKKNDKEDSYKLAKLLRLKELPEVHLLSRFSDDLRSIVRYRMIWIHSLQTVFRVHSSNSTRLYLPISF